MRLAGQGETEHAQTQRGGRGLAAGLERRLRGGNEEETVERELLARRLRHEQVPEVNRIEGTAEESDAFHGPQLKLASCACCQFGSPSTATIDALITLLGSSEDTPVAGVGAGDIGMGTVHFGFAGNFAQQRQAESEQLAAWKGLASATA